jgi:hypothetical protein
LSTPSEQEVTVVQDALRKVISVLDKHYEGEWAELADRAVFLRRDIARQFYGEREEAGA